jgi:anaerobic selenocysteine-containing dehydrogenase
MNQSSNYGEYIMNDESRRSFLAATGKLLVGAAALGSLTAHAAEEHRQSGSGHGLVIDAAVESRCATCQFWGGMRKVSDDKKQVIAQSMGWCNNPDSPNHQKLTAADHHMKKPGVWTKWTVL